jgi:hypothetical protein
MRDSEKETRRRALNWADSLAEQTQQRDPPVDLFAIARRAEIMRIQRQLMFQPGAMIAVDNGFEIYLQSTSTTDDVLDIDAFERSLALASSERFSLAHEIAHTRFYVRLKTKAIPKAERPFRDERELEEVCDEAAGRILVPSSMLMRQIGKNVGSVKKIDAPFVIANASTFCVSPEVILERLRAVAHPNPSPRGLILCRKESNEVQVRDFYAGSSFFLSLPEPKRYRPIATWFQEFPKDFVESESTDCEIERAGHKIAMKKMPWGTRYSFILQVDVVD